MPSLRTVALSSQLAPGTTGDARFATFQLPILNRQGRVAFAASLSGTGVAAANNSGFWFEDSNGLGLIAREGAQAPGTPAGVLFSDLAIGSDWYVVNSAGAFAFLGEMNGPGITTANNKGVWSNVPGSLVLVARAGQSAPGTGAGVVFSNNLFRVMLNDSGALAFSGQLSGSGVGAANNQAVWTNRGGPLSLVGRSGSQIPGLPAGKFLESLSATSFNNSGAIAIKADVMGVPYGTNFVESAGRFRSIASHGWHVEPASYVLMMFATRWPVITDTGIVVTSTGFGEPGAGSTSFHALYTDRSDILLPVAKSLDVAPGTPGLVFGSVILCNVNCAGRVAFLGNLNSPGVTQFDYLGIWSEGFGPLALVVRGGQQAPGAPAGVNLLHPSDPWINGVGQTAFESTLTGTGVDSTNDLGIYVEESPGVVTEIAREGDELEVAPGDVRTIAALDMLIIGNADVNRRFAFNDAGQLALKATFVDGSEGIFVASVGTTFTDCDNDGIPDVSELLRNDCNTNSQPDNCDIALGVSQDCNSNGFPDECEPLSVDLVVEGAFESGDFSGWTPGIGFAINNGDINPPGPSGTFVPYGRFSAFNPTSVLSTSILTHDVAIPANAQTAVLSWIDEIRNYGTQFANPAQSFRVELRTTTDVTLATVFTTQPGETLIRPPTTRFGDVSAYAGRVVRLAFIIQATQAFMNVQIDNVRLEYQATSNCDNDSMLDQCEPGYMDVDAFAETLLGLLPFDCIFDANHDGIINGRDIPQFVRRITG